jgi:hypothetical protein
MVENPSNPKSQINKGNKRVLIFTLVFVLLSLSLLAIWFVYNSKQNLENAKESTTKTKTTNPSISTTSTEKVSKNLKEFVNSEAGFSLKYPDHWLISSYQDGPLCNPDHTFISPLDYALGVCSSGVGGIISITRTPSGVSLDQVFPNYSDHNFKNRSDQDLEIDGKRTKRISGTSQLVSEIDDFREHYFIIYLIDLGDRTLIAQYNQAPGFGDYSKEFEEIVLSLRFI